MCEFCVAPAEAFFSFFQPFRLRLHHTHTPSAPPPPVRGQKAEDSTESLECPANFSSMTNSIYIPEKTRDEEQNQSTSNLLRSSLCPASSSNCYLRVIEIMRGSHCWKFFFYPRPNWIKEKKGERTMSNDKTVISASLSMISRQILLGENSLFLPPRSGLIIVYCISLT